MISWTGSGELQAVNWPVSMSLQLHLKCYTIYDLLGACMSEACRISPSDRDIQSKLRARTRGNFYAPLAHLYTIWCFKLFRTNRDRRPAMTSLAYVDNHVILGCTIPNIPGLPTAKQTIRDQRHSNIQRQHRTVSTDHRANSTHRVTLERHPLMQQDIGHCAESWMVQFMWSL